MTPLLELNDVHFSFGAAPVLHGVSLQVEPRALVGILGPNGSGKTTLLRLIAGGLRPASGRIRLDGADLASVPRRTVARRLAVVPQETVLAFDYSVLEIVLMGRYPHLGAFEVEGPGDFAAAAAALEATGTSHLAERPFRTLSGGEKQRVIIASALAQLDGGGSTLSSSRPEGRRVPTGTSDGMGSDPFASAGLTPSGALLLLDEPTASLDLRYQLEVAKLLERLHGRHDITILLSTHDLRFATSVCTDVLLLSNGRVLAHGAPVEVLTASRVGELYEIDPAVAPGLMR